MLVAAAVLMLASAAYSSSLEELFRGGTVKPPASGTSRPPGAPPASPTSRAIDDQKALLDAHNKARAKHCLTPLIWSAEAERAAQKWASSCKRDAGNRFMHDPGNSTFGENLAWGTSLGGAESVGLWYGEIKDFDFAAPVYTHEPQVGHFTQVIWRTTTHVGCAMAVCGGDNYWVCRYSPPGNINVVAERGLTPAQARQSLMRNVPKLCG